MSTSLIKLTNGNKNGGSSNLNQLFSICVGNDLQYQHAEKRLPMLAIINPVLLREVGFETSWIQFFAGVLLMLRQVTKYRHIIMVWPLKKALTLYLSFLPP